MKNLLTAEQLANEKTLLEQADAGIKALMDHLRTGLPNREKNEVVVKLLEGSHWLRDAQESLAAFTARQEETRAAQDKNTDGVAKGVEPTNVVTPPTAAFSGKAPEGTVETKTTLEPDQQKRNDAIPTVGAPPIESEDVIISKPILIRGGAVAKTIDV